jgi:LysR family pca operon transcriptional activator
MSQRVIDPRIKLRHIACFLEVARLGSVVNAAEALNVSQPAASKTILELEELLRGKLFDRSRRSLFLTPFGEVFFRHASTSIAALRQGIDAARGSPEATTVKVGALPTVSARILPVAVERFLAEDSGVRARIITGPNDYLLELLRTGAVDFVVGRMAEPDAMVGLTFEHLYSERVVMAVRPGHPLLGKRDFDLAMIEPYRIVMPPPDAVIRRLVDRMLVVHGVTRLRNEVETVSNAFGRSFVRRTDAVWIISEGVVAEDVAEKQLFLLPVDMAETTGPVGLTRRTDTEITPVVAHVMQAIRDAAAEAT